MSRATTFVIGTIALIAIGVVVTVLLARDTLEPAAGFLAREVCNEHFVGGREPEVIRAQDMVRYDPNLSLISAEIEQEPAAVVAGFGPLYRMRAVHRPGYGCTLVRGSLAPVPELEPVTAIPWVRAEAAQSGFDSKALEAALDQVFTDPLPNHRALLIAHQGALITERYAPGFNAGTPMLSFSMAKSITAMMVGAAMVQGLIALDDRPPIAAWADPQDPRHEISWRHLLQMQSGLELQEQYTDLSADVPQMNIMAHAAGAYAINKPLLHPPGTHWQYSTGTSNILQTALRTALEQAEVDYHRFAQQALFAPLGTGSVVLVPDSSGTFIGGSYAYATAADWARLGQLYLQDGRHEGQQMLPAGFAAFTATAASDSDGRYGAQVWLNQDGATGRERYFPTLPKSSYFFSGWQGQVVIIIPDWDMVIVHLGRTPEDHRELDPINAALERLVPSFPFSRPGNSA